MKAKLIYRGISRKKSNDGDLVKLHIFHYEGEDGSNAVIINKLLLTDHVVTHPDVIQKLSKTFKGKYLYEQTQSYTLETFCEIAYTLMKNKQNHAKQILSETN